MSISFPCLDLFFLFFTDCLKQYGDFLCKSFSPQPRRMLLWVGFLLVFVDSWSRVLKESLEVSKCESRTIPKHTTCLTEWRFLHVFFRGGASKRLKSWCFGTPGLGQGKYKQVKRNKGWIWILHDDLNWQESWRYILNLSCFCFLKFS